MWSCSIAGIDVNKMSQFKEYINEQVDTIETTPEEDAEHFNDVLSLLGK